MFLPRVFALSFLLLAVAAGSAAADTKSEAQLGNNASLGGRRPFPPDNVWNTDVSQMPVDARSDKWIASMGADLPVHPDFGASYRGKPFGIPYVVVPGNIPRSPVTFEYADESDQGYYPIPAHPPVEGDEDSHIIMIDRDNWRLWELYAVHQKGNLWTAGSGALFDLSTNAQRPAGWTSADAAGLPIFPGLVRYDEVVEQKQIQHALRFTCKRTRHGYVAPARHAASKITDENVPPMGIRVRLKASFDLSQYPLEAQVVLKALKRYGMLLADNGGNWFISGTADSRWDDNDLSSLKRLKGRDFEVVRAGDVTVP